MGTEGFVWIGLAIAGMAFLAEYVDSTLGMGYGTTLTPILLLMGYDPFQVVPAVLFSELVTGLLAGAAHHSAGNANFALKSANPGGILQSFKKGAYVRTIRNTLPRHLKIVLLIASCSILGSLVAVLVAVNISKFWLKTYIGLMVLGVGVLTIATAKRKIRFSWPKIAGLSVLASFNKAMTGGGYGPIVCAGQLVCGVESRSAVAITSFAEGLTCAVAFSMLYLIRGITDWTLFPWLVVGATLSVPLSVYTVKRVNASKLRFAIGVFAALLGVFTLIKTLA